MDSQSLYVSNYLREVEVPFRDVRYVKESGWASVRPVRISFDRDTGFGRAIVFLPDAMSLLPFSPHPVVAELRDAAARAHGTSDDTETG
jgi:hypothetical protein